MLLVRITWEFAADIGCDYLPTDCGALLPAGVREGFRSEEVWSDREVNPRHRKLLVAQDGADGRQKVAPGF